MIYGILHSSLSVIPALVVQAVIMVVLLFPVFAGSLTAGTYISTQKSVNDLIQKISLELMQTIRGLKKSAFYMQDFDRAFSIQLMQQEEGAHHLGEKEGNVRIAL